MHFKLKIVAFLILTTSFSSFATRPSSNMNQFCNDRRDNEYVKTLTKDPDNLMAFRNFGGIGGGGVCWWHSRFQRNSLYLTIFKPHSNRPTEDEAYLLIKKLRAGREIVTIPGYENLRDFSLDFQVMIQEELEAWQRTDGAKFAWVRGLRGKSVVSADKMKTLMDELYTDVEIRGNIAYQKLQIKGITAHAWLVVNMKKERNGYLLEVIDSNYPRVTMFYRYEEGDTRFNHEYYGEFTPYLEETKEMERIVSTIQGNCNSQKLSKN